MFAANHKRMDKLHKHNFAAVVLAAGKGTRMRSALPKVLHRLGGKPMIVHVLHTLAPLLPQAAVVVVAPGMQAVQQTAQAALPGCLFAEQTEQLGTGHAVRMALPQLPDSGLVLVLYGDTPLIRTHTLAGMLQRHREEGATISLLGMRPESPMGYGRLVMATPPWVDAIVECKDATPAQKTIPWVWGGVMAFDAAFLKQALPAVQPSPATKEYYLTALLGMAAAAGGKSLMIEVSTEEVMGINDRIQLAQAEQLLQQTLRQRAMEQGVTLIDPQSIYLHQDTQLAPDVVIHPHVVFGPGVRVESGVEIRSFCHIEGAHIRTGARVGPFARLRPGTVLGEQSHVGNFVEVKNATLGEGAKANHLAYIGDSEVGRGANIGAGTITCNYDGVAKHRTVIGEEAFIGSNTALVAPVEIGRGAVVAAGSVITEKVPEGALAIARSRQTNKPGKAKRKG